MSSVGEKPVPRAAKNRFQEPDFDILDDGPPTPDPQSTTQSNQLNPKPSPQSSPQSSLQSNPQSSDRDSTPATPFDDPVSELSGGESLEEPTGTPSSTGSPDPPDSPSSPTTPLDPDSSPPPRNKGGRPRSGVVHFPAPATYFYRSDASLSAHRSPRFFEYWERLFNNKSLDGRVRVYIYRTFPVIDRERVLNPNTGKPVKNKCIEGPVDYFPAKDLQHRYGSGDYLLILSDAQARKTICQCHVETDRDYLNYPPVIDVEDLVVEDPKNRSYLDWRRRNNLPIPGETTNNERDSDMGNQVVEQLTGTVERLTDRLMDNANRRGPEERVEVLPSVDSEAVKLMSEAGASSMRLVENAMNKALSVQAGTQDPLALINSLVNVVEKLNGGRKDDAVLLETLRELKVRNERLEEKLTQSQTERLAALETRLTDMVHLQQHPPPVLTPSVPTDPLSQIRELAKIKGELKDILDLGGRDEGDEDEDGGGGGGGRRRRRGEPEEPWYAKLLPIAVGLVPFALSAVSSIVHNQAVARTGQGNPVAPPAPPPPTPGTIPPALEAALQSQDLNQPSNPNNPVSTGASQVHPAQLIVNTLKDPMRNHLDGGAGGEDFAAWLIEGHGAVYHSMLQQAGKDQIILAIRTFAPDLYQMLQSLGPKADQFIDEFLHYDPNAEEEGEGEGK